MFCIPFAQLTDTEITALAANKLDMNPDVWERNIWSFIVDWFNPSINAIHILTSGSTGTPKQVTHSKQAMRNSAVMTLDYLNIKKGDNALLCLPANKIGGRMMLVRSLVRKLNLYCVKPTANPLADIPTGAKINLAAFTPTQLNPLSKDYGLFRKADAIDKILLGGENTPAELLQWTQRLTNEVYATFGMTETISHIALKRLNGSHPDEHFRVLPDIKISTTDDSRLVIEAPGLEQPKLTTNDVVRIMEPGVFDWLGRTDNVINSGGVKIHPEELEQKLQAHIQPAFFIAAMPDAITGERVVLALEMEELSANDKQELLEVIGSFDKISRPKNLLLFRSFQRTENGKIRRRETLQNAHEDIPL